MQKFIWLILLLAVFSSAFWFKIIMAQTTDYCSDFVYYCLGYDWRKHKFCHERDKTSWQNEQLVQNCSDYNTYYDTGLARWVDFPDNDCFLKEQSKWFFRWFDCQEASGCYMTKEQFYAYIDTGRTKPKANGTICDDGDPATGDGSCQAGLCEKGRYNCPGTEFSCGLSQCLDCSGTYGTACGYGDCQDDQMPVWFCSSQRKCQYTCQFSSWCVPIPPQPNNLKHTTNTGNSITWAWDKTNGASEYQVFDAQTDELKTTTSLTTYTWPNLGSNTKKGIYLKTCNAGGCSQATESNYAYSSSALPKNLSGRGVLNNQINWSWSSGQAEAGFEVSSDNLVWQDVGQATSFSQKDLNCQTTYTLYLKSYNGDGNSSPSLSAQAQTLGCQPADLIITELNWSDSQHLDFAFKNQGNALAPSFSYRLYLSNSLLGTYKRSSTLLPQRIITSTISYPAGCGHQTTKLILDVNNEVEESDENNNSQTIIIPNCPPSQPTNEKVEIKKDKIILSWQGEEPDGDALTYYLGLCTKDQKSGLCSLNLAGWTTIPSFEIEITEPGYVDWKIYACDSFGLCTTSPRWSFEIE